MFQVEVEIETIVRAINILSCAIIGNAVILGLAVIVNGLCKRKHDND